MRSRRNHSVFIEFLALEVRLNASEQEFIPAGIRIHLIKSPRGSYVRTPDGKFFAIRTPALFDQQKPMPVISAPPRPPPPPPSVPKPTPSASSLLEDLLFGKIMLVR